MANSACVLLSGSGMMPHSLHAPPAFLYLSEAEITLHWLKSNALTGSDASTQEKALCFTAECLNNDHVYCTCSVRDEKENGRRQASVSELLRSGYASLSRQGSIQLHLVNEYFIRSSSVQILLSSCMNALIKERVFNIEHDAALFSILRWTAKSSRRLCRRSPYKARVIIPSVARMESPGVGVALLHYPDTGPGLQGPLSNASINDSGIQEDEGLLVPIRPSRGQQRVVEMEKDG
ncbi:unnamed protein product [Leuciscus chuanchicus]